MKLIDALKLETLKRATVVAGADALDRPIRWVHVVDVPNPLPWLREGDFLLTTGYAWPRDGDGQYRLIEEFAKRGLAGVGLAAPNFFQHMPDEARRAADENNFPLIEIPWDIPFSSITEEVHRSILSFQRELLEQSESIHRELMKAVLEAESLQDIADTLCSLISRDIVVEHPEGGVLACAESAIPHRRGQAAAGDHYQCPIYIKRELAGYLNIGQQGIPMNELDIRAAEYAAVVIALHLSQQRALASLETQLGYSFLESLQEGSFEPTAQMLKRAQILGFDPEGVYGVGMFILNAQVPLSRDGIIRREKFAENLRRALHAMDASALLSLSQNQISFLLPERCSPHLIWERLKTPDVSLFLSRNHQGYGGVRKGYAEVCSLIPYSVPGQNFRFEDLLVHRVLIGEPEARAQFLDKWFLALKQNKGGDVLVETLLAAARSGFHLKRTAEAMCIHPKTLRYRLDRAVTLGGFDLENPQTRFELQLAERILSLEAK